MTFLKEHLVCHHYNWSTGTTHSMTDSTGLRVSDRSNGNQISLIIKELPAALKSESALFNWLKENIHSIGIKNKTVTF